MGFSPLIYNYLDFFNVERIKHPTTEPAAIASKYNDQLFTVAITNTPPCGALNWQSNATDKPPATAEPITHDGITWIGSLAANGIAPSEMKDSPMI